MLRTADQLAAVFNVTPSTVRRWATRTAEHAPCPHTKDGLGRLRFDPDQVDEWLTQTGVLKRSRAQTRYTPPPSVAMLDVIRWRPQDVTTQDTDRDLHALHRTVKTCLHVCTHHEQLPTPPDLDRDAAIEWLADLAPRPAEDWKRLAREAIDNAGDDAFMDAVYGT